MSFIRVFYILYYILGDIVRVAHETMQKVETMDMQERQKIIIIIIKNKKKMRHISMLLLLLLPLTATTATAYKYVQWMRYNSIRVIQYPASLLHRLQL